MFLLNLPIQSPLQKTITKKQISIGVNSEGGKDVSVTAHLMLSKLSGDANLTKKEYSEVKSVYKNAGSEPVLLKDPTDYKATRIKKEDGYGGWTQGVFIWSAYLHSGFFAKTYGLVGNGAIHELPMYIRPVAFIENGRVFPDANNESVFLTAEFNPDTQRAKIDGLETFEALPFVQSIGSASTIANSSVAIAAEFEFKQAYEIITLREKPTESVNTLIGCDALTRVSYALQEKNINTLALFYTAILNETAQ